MDALSTELVAAFASRADLLVLDEPTAGLDPLMEMAFRETVQEARRRGQPVFLSSHILSEVEALCASGSSARDASSTRAGGGCGARRLPAARPGGILRKAPTQPAASY